MNPSTPYISYTLPQLRNYMTGVSSLNKAALIERLNEYDIRRRYLEEARATKERQEAEHRATRSLVLRRQREADVDCLEYPFSFLRNGDYDAICDPMPGQPEEDIGTFPENIRDYLWVHPGENDEEPWLCLCQLTNDVYVFYKGECDYTGFDCQGTMKMYASRDPCILLQFAMTESDFKCYEADCA